MQQLLTIAFDDPLQAGRMLDTLKALEREGLLILADTAAVMRDVAGRVTYRTAHELPGAGAGALMGGLWGAADRGDPVRAGARCGCGGGRGPRRAGQSG